MTLSIINRIVAVGQFGLPVGAGVFSAMADGELGYYKKTTKGIATYTKDDLGY